jgi:hypothetical protein
MGAQNTGTDITLCSKMINTLAVLDCFALQDIFNNEEIYYYKKNTVN